MTFICLVYAVVVIRNIISDKYITSEGKTNPIIYGLLAAPICILLEWLINRNNKIIDRFDRSFFVMILLTVPFVVIHEIERYEANGLLYSVLMVWSISIAFNSNGVSALMCFLTGCTILIYQ